MIQLAQIMHHASADAEQRRAKERPQQRDEGAAKKATIGELLDQSLRDNDAGQKFA